MLPTGRPYTFILGGCNKPTALCRHPDVGAYTPQHLVADSAFPVWLHLVFMSLYFSGGFFTTLYRRGDRIGSSVPEAKEAVGNEFRSIMNLMKFNLQGAVFMYITLRFWNVLVWLYVRVKFMKGKYFVCLQ